MKLKLNISLRRALYTAVLALAAHASSIATTLVSSSVVAAGVAFTLSVPQAEANIYTWDPNAVDGLIDTEENWTGEPPLTDWTASWNDQHTNMMRFTGASVSNGAVTSRFNTLAITGFVVDAGATGYGLIGSSNESRSANLYGSTATDAAALRAQGMAAVDGEINFIVNEDFYFGNAATRWISLSLFADANANIAQGKTLYMHTKDLLSDSAVARNFDVNGAGTMKLHVHGSLSADISWSVRDSATLCLSTGSLFTGAVDVSDHATLSLASGTTSLGNATFSGNSTLDATLLAGTSLTGNVTMDRGTSIALTVGSRQDTSLSLTSFTLSPDITTGFISLDLTLTNPLVLGESYILIDGLMGNEWLTTDFVCFLDGTQLDYDLIIVDGQLILNVPNTTPSLVWESGDGTWSTNNANTPWQGSDFFTNGDIVIFGGDGGVNGGIVTIEGDVSPASIRIKGNGDWEFVAAAGGGSISGSSSLIKSGNGTLTMSSANSYTGGTMIDSGSVIINAAGALGTGAVEMAVGSSLTLLVDGALSADAALIMNDATLVLGGNFHTLDAANITIKGGNFTINLLDSIAVDMINAGAITGDQNLVLTGTGSLNLDAWSAVTSADIADGVVLNIGGSTGSELSRSITGTGTVLFDVSEAAGNYNLKINVGDFAGTLIHNGVEGLVLTIDGHSDQERISLDVNTQQGTVINSAAAATLYLDALSGTGIMRFDWSTSMVGTRNLDLLMSHDNVFSGTIKHHARMGNLLVDSAAGANYSFTLDGIGNVTNSTSETSGALEVGNAQLILSGAAQWNGRIMLVGTDGVAATADDAGATLTFDSLAAAYTRGTGAGIISGGGSVIIKNSTITLSGENTYSGTTTVMSGSLSLGHVSAAGTSALMMQGGTLDLANNAISNAITTTAGSDVVITNSSAYRGVLTVNNALSINGLGDADVVVNTGANLTLSGNVALTAAMSLTLNGSLTLDPTIVFDLSEYGYKFGDATITIFEGTGLNLAGTGFTSLTGENLTGIAGLAGLGLTFNADGTIDVSMNMSIIDAIGGTSDAPLSIEWNTKDANFIADGAATIFDPNDIVNVDGYVNLHATENIVSSSIILTADSVLNLSAATGLIIDVASIDMGANSVLGIAGNILAAGNALKGDASNLLVLSNLGESEDNASSIEAAGASYAGSIEIADGRLHVNAGSFALVDDFAITNGASLWLDGVTLAVGQDITINSSEADALQLGGATVNSTITATVDSSIMASGATASTINGALVAQGSLALSGSADMTLSSVSAAGVITINNSSKTIFAGDVVAASGIVIDAGDVNFGKSENDTNSFDVSSVQINKGATLTYQHTVATFDTDIVLNGGTLHGFDMNRTSGSVFGDLVMQSDSVIKFTYNGGFSFDSLTGDGLLQVAGGGEDCEVNFGAVKDFNGTLEQVVSTGKITTRISINGTVDQAAGHDMLVQGTGGANSTVSSSGIVKKGEGSLKITGTLNSTGSVSVNAGSLAVTGTLNSTGSVSVQGGSLTATDILAGGSLSVTSGSLTVTGTVTATDFTQSGGVVNIGSLVLGDNANLGMNYTGDLTLGAIAVGSDALLNYNNAAGLITLSAADLAVGTQLHIFVQDVDLATMTTGFNLGIASDIAKDQIFIEGFATGDYTLVVIDGSWHLSTTVAAQFDWDSNWDNKTLVAAPDTILSSATITETIALFDATVGGVNPYSDGAGNYSIELTGGGNSDTSVIGLTNVAAYNEASQKVTANSWIRQTGGEFHTIAGLGSYGNWALSTINEIDGDVHIEVDVADAGSLIYLVGGSLAEGAGIKHNGDTFISVYTDSVSGSIFGGTVCRAMHGVEVVGNSNIFIYSALTQTTDVAYQNGGIVFNAIIGGQTYMDTREPATSGIRTLSQTGNTNIVLDLSDYVVDGEQEIMAKRIVGAHYARGGTLPVTLTGTSNITITGHDGVTLSGYIIGGVNHGGGHANSHVDATNITIASGNFTGWIIGGSSYHEARSTVSKMSVGNADINIASGNFAGTIVGGNVLGSGVATLEGVSNIDITGGAFTGSIVAGSTTAYVTAGTTVTVNSNILNLNISGSAAFGEAVNGGHVLTAGTGIFNSNVISSDISGGHFTNVFVGGSSAASTVLATFATGIINMDISGATFDGAVYAENYLSGNATASSTTKEINFTLSAGELKDSVYVGSAITNNGDVSVDTESIKTNLTGGSVAGTIYGAVNATAGTGSLSVEIGDVNVILDGATIGNLYAGSWIERSTATTLTQGNIAISLLSGTINGDRVVAAGYQGGDANMTTASTSVTISSLVQATAADGLTISGGYDFALGKTGSTVTGDRSLIFDSTTAYTNLSNFLFEDFNVVSVGEGASVDFTQTKTPTSLSDLDALKVTKKGAGTLLLAASNGSTNLVINAGTVKLATSSSADTLASINVQSGATLDMSNVNTGVGSSLLLQQGSTLAINTAVNGAAFAAGGSLILAENAKINLSITGDVTELFSYTLFSGLALEDITGINLTENPELAGLNAVLASEVLDGLIINGTVTTLGNDVYLIFEDGELVLSNSIVGDMVWSGGSANWNNTGKTWEMGGHEVDFLASSNAIFDTTGVANSQIDVNGEVIVTDMTVTDVASDYSFTTSGNLTITGDLSILAGADASFDTAVDVGGIVTIAAGSSLIFGTGTQTIQTLDNSGSITADALVIVNNVVGQGNITAKSVVLQGSNNQVGTLIAETVTASGSLSIGSGSDLGTLISNGTTNLTTSGAVSIDSVTGSLASLSNTGSLTLAADLTIDGTLSNTGTLNMGGSNLVLNSVAAQGGTVLGVKDITLAGGDSFAAITASGSITTQGDLTLGADSTASALVSSGSLNLVGGSLTLSGTSATTLVNLTSDSALTTQGDLIVSGTVSGSGDVKAKAITIGAVGSDVAHSAGVVVAGAGLVVHGDISASSLSAASGVSIAGAATITGDVTTTSGNISIGSDDAQVHRTGAINAGTGMLTTMGSLTSSSVSASELTLGGKLNVTGVLDVDTITIQENLVKINPIIEAGSLMSDLLTINASSVILDGLGITSGESVVLIDLNTAFEGELTLVTDGTGTRKYTIGKNEAGDIIIGMVMTGNSWSGAGEDSLWSNTANWSGNKVPDMTDEMNVALFNGDGAIISVDGEQSAYSINVAGKSSEAIYTLQGEGSLSSYQLDVNKGILKLNVDLNLEYSDTVAGSGRIIIGVDGSLQLGENSTISASSMLMKKSDSSSSELIIDAGSGIVITGELQAAAQEITNNGNLSIGSQSDIGSLLGSGSLTVTGENVTLGSISAAMSDFTINVGASVTISSDSEIDALLNNGSLEIEGKLIVEAGTTFELSGSGQTTVASISDDASVSLLDAESELIIAGNATLSQLNNLGQLTVGGTLTLSGHSSQGGHITAEELVIDTASALLDIAAVNGSSFGDLKVDIVKLDDALSTSEHMLSADSISNQAGDAAAQLYLTQVDTWAKDVSQAVDGKYMIISSNNANVELHVSTATAINTLFKAGKDVFFRTDGDSVELEIVAATDRRWKTSDNFAVTPGLEDNPELVIDPIYNFVEKVTVVGYGEVNVVSPDSNDVLNSVEQIIVDESIIIDLTTSDTSSTDSLLFNNLSGQKGELFQIQGDGVDADFVTLNSSKKDSAATGQFDFVAKDVTLVVTSENDASQSFDNLKLDSAKLDVTDTGDISIGDLDMIDGSIVVAADGELNVDSLSNKDGDKSIISGVINITGSGSKYTGAYTDATINTTNSAASIKLVSSAELSLTGSAGSIELIGSDDAKIRKITTTGATVKMTLAEKPLTLLEESSMDGGILNVVLGNDNLGGALFDGSMKLNGTSILISANSGSLVLTDPSAPLFEFGDDVILDGVDFEFDAVFSKYYSSATVDENGVVSGVRNTSYYDGVASSHNGRAGASLLSEALLNYNPQAAEAGRFEDIKAVMSSMDYYMLTGAQGSADKLAAAVAGASVTALGSAQMSDMERQLGSIRNRTMSMGLNPYETNEEQPTGKAWISAEGGSSKLDNEGTSAGHDLSTFGGSVGVDFDVHENFSFGAAITAMYGSIDSNAADVGDGTLNTQYVTFFARSNVKRWTHSFIASFGSSDADMDRTVNYFGGKYETKGSTDGFSAGLMYELGYTIPLDEEMNTCWQPVFNISFVKSSLDGYTERGSDAGLKVGDQDSSYVTLGLGGRIETVVGTSAYNRASILSARAMFKADMGDRSSEADVSFANAAGSSVTVKGAEAGAVGAEFGIGLTIPVTFDTGAIFMDASVDLRDGMTSGSGSVGYRFAF